MFERYDSLLDRIGAVTRRYRAMRFWWSIAIIALLASLAGWWLLGQVDSGVVVGKRAAIALIVVTGISAFIALLLIRLSYRNPRWVASRIESRFPGLQQRLLTALSQANSKAEELGYLQQRVITDAYQHSLTHRWSEAVPRAASMLSRLSGGLSLVLLAVVTTMLVLASPRNEASARGRLFVPPKVMIEPGNTEIEKGSGLVISARFPATSDMPDELELSMGTQRLALSQSLDDPILSAYVPTIEQPFRYRVVSPNWQSDEYSVELFEFPALVRADATLDYPDYTQLETKRIDDTVRVSAVEGTKLQWNLTLNKPVPSLTVRAKDGSKQAVTIVTGEPSRLRFDVTLLQTEHWTVELVDDRGRKNKYPIALDARAIPNHAPELKLISGGDLIASPLEELSLAATVQDDFGIFRTGIAYSFAGGQTAEVTLGESMARSTKHRVDQLVELEKLGAKPDQLLAYHFWAEDYSGAGEVRRTQSDLYFAEVRPFDEIFREGESPAGGEQQQQQQQNGSQQTEELAELQKQIIAATWKIARDPKTADRMEKFGADVELLQESQQQAIEKAAELAELANDETSAALVTTLTDQMQSAVQHLREAGARVSKQPLDDALVAEQAAYQTLLQLRAHEFQVSRSQRQQRQQRGSSASAQRRQQQLDQLELKNDENRYETQSQAKEQNATEDAQQEDRQILSRLKELAQRQEDINKQLTQLQSALEQAKTEEEKEEVRRQLKRLREQEQELLRDSDELADRMQQPENSQAMSEQAEQLEQTRENLRKSSESLEQNKAAEALAAGTRAERELDQMSEEFRKRAAGEFDDAVREMRTKARELEQAQQQLGQQLQNMSENTEPGLRSGGDREAIQESLQQQKAELSELLEQVQQTVQQAEPSEPLLAQNLYETFRETQQNQLERQMTDTGELLRRGLDPQAQQLQRGAAEATSELRRDLEKAAESVLGNEEKALERALSELERLDQALRSEMSAAGGEKGEKQKDEPTALAAGRSESTNNGESPNGERPEAGTNGSQQQPPQGEAQEGQPGQGQAGQGQARGSGRLEQMGQGGGSVAAPIAGGGFREWSDGLRDVEEMVGDPVLRGEAAAIRDRARQMRQELKRHSEEPQWSLVESMIAKPLRELKMKVTEELLRRSADKSDPVPIDRDPVPDEYSNAVKRYYESLGSGR